MILESKVGLTQVVTVIASPVPVKLYQTPEAVSVKAGPQTGAVASMVAPTVVPLAVPEQRIGMAFAHRSFGGVCAFVCKNVNAARVNTNIVFLNVKRFFIKWF